jgi:type II secretory pathway pseudopilin PulG
VAAEIRGAHAPRVRARRFAERTFPPIAPRSAQDVFGEAPKTAREARALPRPAVHAFTIVELLIVIVIILMLAGLILATSGYVQTKGRRSRAEAEIAAISAALENYKADNGVYPSNNDTKALDPTTTTPNSYKAASSHLYSQMTGDDDADPTTPPTANPKNYFGSALKPNMLGPSPPGPNTYLRDPFGNSYGYSTAKADNPGGTVGYNPTFDLWSTANSTSQSEWIKNW